MKSTSDSPKPNPTLVVDDFKLPKDFDENLSTVKKKISDSLNNNVDPKNKDQSLNSSPEIMDKLDKNIEGLLFKVNLLETKIKQLDKKLDEICQSKDLETDMLRALYSVLHGKFGEGKK